MRSEVKPNAAQKQVFWHAELKYNICFVLTLFGNFIARKTFFPCFPKRVCFQVRLSRQILQDICP